MAAPPPSHPPTEPGAAPASGAAPRQSSFAGSSPGKLVYIGRRRTRPARVTVIDYASAGVEELEIPRDRVDRLGEYVASDSVTWIDVDGVHDLEIVETLGRLFGLHPLTIEDLADTSQRPKFEMHDGHLSLALKMCAVRAGRLHTEHLTLLLGKHWVLSFQEEPGDVFEKVRQRIRGGRGRLRTSGPDYLANCLVDAVVDEYFAVLEHTGDELTKMEDRAAAGASQALMSRLHVVRRDLVLLRKSVWPLREAVGGLRRDESELVAADTLPYLADVHDHATQVVESVDVLRELTASVRELYLSTLNLRMNDTMRVLTLIATIFIPLSFVAGVYGMNFKDMPELDSPWGYPAVLTFMGLVGGSMLVYFRRKQWI